MAFGKTVKKDLKAFSLKIKTKDLAKPEFLVSERQDGKFVELAERESTVSGNLIGIEPKDFNWQGKTIKSVNVTLTDNDQIYFISLPFSNLGRGLMNSFLALKKFDNVEIGLYQTKPKVAGGKTYPAGSLRQNGEMVRWKFSQDQLPIADEIVFKGEKMRDWTKQEDFLCEQLKELNKVIRSTTPAQAQVAVEVPVASAEDDTLDAPF